MSQYLYRFHHSAYLFCSNSAIEEHNNDGDDGDDGDDAIVDITADSYAVAAVDAIAAVIISDRITVSLR